MSQPWQDATRPIDERVDDLVHRMTLEEKLAQLVGLWVGVDADDHGGGEVAPYQHDLSDGSPSWDTIVRTGLGQLTRPFGTAPVEPAVAARALAKAQSELVAGNRFGIPAIAHEECLTGLMAWKATAYPTPLAWGASFDPELVERMAEQIGTSMRQLGVHQGLAPVLDVTMDPRWGRTEETIGEDPCLVGRIGTAYVRGLESTGIIATLKHFAGYSASTAGRNLAPAAIGPRRLAEVLLPPFEMALREGGARSVMHSYTELDGVPAAASVELLSDMLRDQWGFDGTVVADYFGIAFLERLHGIAASPGEAAALALTAGVDVELPSVRCYAEPLAERVRAGEVDEALVDRAASRVLRQKAEFGMLDPDWDPERAAAIDRKIDLDPPEARRLAARLAEESTILLANDGVLPLPPEARLAVVGPMADDPMAMMGCYAFPNHVARHRPDVPIALEIPTVAGALRSEHAGTRQIVGDDPMAARLAASRADICVAVLGDRSSLFGHGTSGEGCDAADLRLPGEQERFLEGLLDTGTPVVLVLLTGRPYALGAYVDRLAGIVQAFFPGEEGGAAVAGVLTGRICPSGRLPVSVPRDPGGQPSTYLAPPLGHATRVSSIDPTPLFGFGHGLSYTTFEWSEPRIDRERFRTDETVRVSVRITNVGERSGTEVVQLYLHDPVAQVTRPVQRLIGFTRIELRPGATRTVDFEVHADTTSFIGLAGQRVVEPGDLELRLGASNDDIRATLPVRLTGPLREIGHRRVLNVPVTLSAP